MEQTQLLRVVVSRYLMAFIALAALFFLPAGTFNYWQAWAYLGVLFGMMFVMMLYMLKTMPELLERRMRTKERVKEQSLIVKLSYFPFLLAFILPGFDRRYRWTHPPVWLVLLALAVVILGYILVVWVFRENSYASRGGSGGRSESDRQRAVCRGAPSDVCRHVAAVCAFTAGIGLVYRRAPRTADHPGDRCPYSK